MYINYSRVALDGFEQVYLGHNILNYKLSQNDIFKEFKEYYMFLDSNYSESFINSSIDSIKNVKDLKHCFRKDGVLIIVEKSSGKIIVNRDLAGLNTCYYYRSNDVFVMSSNVHELAKTYATGLNKKHIYQLLYFDFLWDGQTIYDKIEQVKAGSELVINNIFNITSEKVNQPDIDEDENNLSDLQNITDLRSEIVKAHKPYLNRNNTVFLSGGIDSVAMLIALDDLTEKKNIKNHSFKVKGTIQDETEYAESIANHLSVDLKIIERDFKNEFSQSIFESKILEMNNPYSGMWIFGNQINNQSNTTYFAGQDTRLHTPALNILDQFAFNIFTLSKKGLLPVFMVMNILLSPIRGVMNFILSNKVIHNKKFLGLRRALHLFNTKNYLNLVYFKLDKSYLKSLKLPLTYFESVSEDYDLDISKVKNQRVLYNTIVSKKWIEQYVNDMRYMVDMVKTQGGKLAMPFYDMDLAKFSGTIPFKLANKTMKGKGQFDNLVVKVNKFVLREALADKIDQKTYLRSKAVSRTGHLIFTQGLNEILKNVISKDLSKEISFVKENGLTLFLDRFLNQKEEWIMNDDKYLLKVYYTACLIIYNNELNIR